MFERLFSRLPAAIEEPMFPHAAALTTEEKEKEFVILIELPDFTPEEIEVEVTEGWLLVKARHEEKVFCEAGEGEVEELARRVDLPPNIVIDAVTATLRHGVLEVVLPKVEAPRVRQVEVKT